MKIGDQLIFHFRSNTGASRNATLIAIISEDNVLRISASLCSKKDQFVKKIGIKIAKGRFDKGVFVAEVDLHDGFKITPSEVRELCFDIGLGLSIYGYQKEQFVVKENAAFGKA